MACERGIRPGLEWQAAPEPPAPNRISCPHAVRRSHCPRIRGNLQSVEKVLSTRNPM